MKVTNNVVATAVGTALVATVAGVAWLIACAQGPDDYKTVESISPPHLAEYAGGQLGVVRPKFARRFLIQAYRGYSGRPPLADSVRSPADMAPPEGSPARPTPLDQWKAARQQVFPGTEPPGEAPLASARDIGNYQYIDNCLDDAFATAVRTLNDRIAKYTPVGAEAQDWVRAQDAVFANCRGGDLVLPRPAASSADALVRADRAYQIAAAHFYATDYETAARLFSAIGAGPSSPWRPFGRYLAARALLRQATVRDEATAAAERLTAAEAQLKAVLGDPTAAPVHASARGLLDFAVGRARPLERIGLLSTALVRDRGVSFRDLVDYQVLMDRAVGDTTTLEYATIANRDSLAAGGDLTDWILTMQASGDGALAHALQRWKATRAAPWLVATLWKLPPSHPDAPALMAAAQQVDKGSPAFATLAFLRVRLLAQRGAAGEARQLLATLPQRPGPGVSAETLNLFAAERFMLATSLAELLANGPRTIVVEGEAFGQPTFDEDAGRVLSLRLPLARLIEAASSALPDRLRVRVAGAAFTRALLLRRYDDARAVLPAFEPLAPSARADLRRFAEAKTDADRHIAGVLLLLRTPGLDTHVRGIDDSFSYSDVEPSRTLEHLFGRNWWCDANHSGWSEVMPLIYGGEDVPYPSFVTAAERKAVEDERVALNGMGPAANYLAAEAVKWARERPTDADAAEALALAVQGTRWGCGDDKTSNASRLAFQTLHKLFPKSEWARRTKYWY